LNLFKPLELGVGAREKKLAEKGKP